MPSPSGLTSEVAQKDRSTSGQHPAHLQQTIPESPSRFTVSRTLLSCLSYTSLQPACTACSSLLSTVSPMKRCHMRSCTAGINKVARVVVESRSGLCYVLDYDGQGLELRDRIQPVYSNKPTPDRTKPSSNAGRT